MVPICLYMVCKYWSSHVRRSYRKLGVFAVQKARKLGMYCVKCNTFERLWEAIMTSTMIPLLYTHIKLRGYAFRCAKIWWYFAHFLHTHAQSVRTQQWLIVDVIIASIVYRDRWWGGTLLSNWPISANFRCRNSLYQYTLLQGSHAPLHLWKLSYGTALWHEENECADAEKRRMLFEMSVPTWLRSIMKVDSPTDTDSCVCTLV